MPKPTKENCNLGQYAITGGPGRPKGYKEKATRLKERIIDTILKLDAESESGDALSDMAKNRPSDFVSLVKVAMPKDSSVELSTDGDIKISVELTPNSDGTDDG